jgi:hypothetical protein
MQQPGGEGSAAAAAMAQQWRCSEGSQRY